MTEIECLKKNILDIWDEEKLSNSDYVKSCIDQMLHLLTEGKIRSCDNNNGNWTVNSWVKKGILLLFKTVKADYFIQDKIYYRDKILPLCGKDLNEGVRLVPTCYVRKGVFLGKNVVVMPSFINIGAYVDSNTMIDSYATVGSCSQIGKNCHISSNAVVAGVLEPLQSMPVIIEDECFVGAGCVLSEGVVIRKGSVLGAGVVLTATTKIFNLQTGEIIRQEIPPYSVVVPGVMKSPNSEVFIQSAVIIKTVDASTRKKTSINDLLRDK